MAAKISYTTINHIARKRLNLSLTEYCLVDLVYHLANNPGSICPGWCYAKKESMGNEFGVDKRSITRIVSRMLSIGLLEKHPETRYLRATSTWYNSVIINKYDSENTGNHGNESPTRDKMSLAVKTDITASENKSLSVTSEPFEPVDNLGNEFHARDKMSLQIGQNVPRGGTKCPSHYYKYINKYRNNIKPDPENPVDNSRPPAKAVISGKTQKAKPKVPEGYQEAVDHLLKTWTYPDGTRYALSGKDCNGLKMLLRWYTLDKVMALIDLFWKSCSDWTKKNIGRSMAGLLHERSRLLDDTRLRAIELKYAVQMNSGGVDPELVSGLLKMKTI